MEETTTSRVEYTTPPRVQAWFLQLSRDKWKQKGIARNEELKRKKNLVASVKKSRERWYEEVKQLRRRMQELESQNQALRDQLAAEKKDGLGIVFVVS